MVFSSIPAYLDPANWHQQASHQAGIGNAAGSQLLPPPPPPPGLHPHGSGSAGSIRPGSMADRARMANIPMPEAGLKCPRCDSTNTKFCYFNNYNLSQPRHFCKTCRRYWTRGGALRNVPVGGGCRRNKRSKSSSKSSTASDRQAPAPGSGPSTAGGSNSGNTDIIGQTQPQVQALRFMQTPLHQQLFASSGDQIGLNYGGVSQHGSGAGEQLSMGSVLGLEHWRLQQPPPQFPFFGGLDPSSGLFESGNENSGYAGHDQSGGSSGISLMASLKMEQKVEDNLGRQFIGVSGNDHYWCSGSTSTAAWMNPSGFSSSSASTSNPL